MPATPVMRGTPTCTSGTTAANVTATEPTTAANDILIANLYIEADNAVTPPAGWSAAFGPAGLVMMAENNTASHAYRQYMYWIRRGAAAPSLIWTFLSAFRFISMASFSGAQLGGNPFSFAAFAMRDDIGSNIIPTVTGRTLYGNELAVWAANTFDGPTAWAPPSGFTERFDSSGFAQSWADLIVPNPTLVTAANATETPGPETASGMLVGLRPQEFMPKITSRPFPYKPGSSNVSPRGR